RETKYSIDPISDVYDLLLIQSRPFEQFHTRIFRHRQYSMSPPCSRFYNRPKIKLPRACREDRNRRYLGANQVMNRENKLGGTCGRQTEPGRKEHIGSMSGHLIT